MTMQNQDRDWLDDKIAAKDYIPDDGFTARVIGELPKARPNHAASLRRRILFFSTSIALILLVIQALPLIQELRQLNPRYVQAEVIQRMNTLFHQPVLIFGVAGCVFLIAFLSIPLLRRWV